MEIKYTIAFSSVASTCDLVEYIESELNQSYSDGLVEQAVEQARKNSRAIAILVDRLVENRKLTNKNIQDICGTSDTIEFI